MAAAADRFAWMPKKFVHKIAAASLASNPWKNGGGRTRQIEISPEGASLEKADFAWRLSAADIVAPGPFSQFPDFERLLTLVKGEEVVLEFADLRKILKPGTVVRFDGDDAVEARLPKGPVSDLGLIYDPDQVMAKMTLVELKARPRSFALSAPKLFLFCIAGELAVSVFPGEIMETLGAGDTLCIGEHESERVVFLDPGAENVTVVAVEIAEIEVASN